MSFSLNLIYRCTVFIFLVLLLFDTSICLAEEARLDDPATWANPSFWESLNQSEELTGWEFHNGEISLVRPRTTGSILSQPVPSDFELSFEWKIAAKVNSGVKYRVRKHGAPYWTSAYKGSGHWGFEYQIYDEKSNTDALHATGAIYDLSPADSDKVVNPPGEWNVAKIVANGSTVEHYLNGSLVSSIIAEGPEWERTIALSKFAGFADFGQSLTKSQIMLTDHGGQVSYRKFRFVVLAPGKQAAVEQTGPFLADGMRNSWADQNSISIWTRTTQFREMNSAGQKFQSLSTKQAKVLEETEDAAEYLSDQLPSGASLDDMIGACPGAAGEVRLIYFPEKRFKAKKEMTQWKKTTADDDFTAQWHLEGLSPGTRYVAVLEVRKPDSHETTAILRGGFATAPAKNARTNLTFCMTTCHDFIRTDNGLQGHKIYPSMEKINPSFLVHAGDIEYYDKPDPWALTVELMRFKWGRIFALPDNRSFYKSHTAYFLKDDHDTLKNDCWPGQQYGAVTFEEGVRLFNEEQFPSRTPRYQTVQWGKDLQVWFLEGRDFRSPNTMSDGPEKTILGAEQKAWLFKTLGASTAKFKLVFSPTPIVGPDRSGKKDNHANTIFAHEGEQLRRKFSAVDGVIVLCGDRHWQYASVDVETGLWEFGCGPGSEKHQLGWKKGDERPSHRFLRVAGGFLSGHLESKGQSSELTMHHRTVNGDVVSTFRFPVEKSP
jgi:alkaline phosphatase D